MEQHTTSPAPAHVAPLCGVYRITNSVTGDCYIGSSTNIDERWRSHQRHLKAGTHHNVRLHNAWRKYGAQSFSLTVLELCAAPLLVETEQRYLDAEHPTYNVAPTAGQGPGMAGKKHSAATRAKLRAVVYTEERRAKIRASRPGIWTPEMRERQRLSHLGKRPSPEAIEKGRQSRMGHPVSEETRRKIGAANAARAHRPHTPETIEKMRAFQRARREREKLEGKPISAARRRSLEAMHAQNRGRRQGSEEIEHRRAALKASYQRKRDAQPTDLLTSSEAAAWLDVAAGTVRGWMREGRLPAQYTPCGRMVVRADLEVFGQTLDQQRRARERRKEKRAAQAQALPAAAPPVIDPGPLVQLRLFPD